MRLLSKILKTGALIIAVVAAVMFIVSLLVQDKVAGIVLKSLSNDLSTKFETGSVKLSFIKKFPLTTLDLKNVLIHSSTGFDRTCFDETGTDTLLSAKSVIMAFKMTDIIRGNYNIGKIGLRNGLLRILTDTAGRVNYEITSGNITKPDDNLVINLEDIYFDNLEALYNNRATKLVIAGIMKNGRLKSNISGNNVDFKAKGNLIIDLFTLYNFKIRKNISADVNVTLNSSKDGVRFDKSSIKLDNTSFSMAGFISSDNQMDLSVTGEKIDLSSIRSYLPEKLYNKVTSYNPQGIMNIESKIRGTATRTSNPRVEIAFSVKDAVITYLHSSPALKNVSFNGLYTNGSKMILATSSLKINNFIGTLGSSTYTGSLSLSNFNKPRADLELKGKLIPAELKEFFHMKEISGPKGSVDLILRMTGILPRKEKYRINDFLPLNNSASLTFNSFGIGLGNDKIRVDNVNGNISVTDKIIARDLNFKYKDQQMKVNGSFINLPEWLAGEPVKLTASADIVSDRIVAESFLPANTSENKTVNTKRSFSLPSDMLLDLNFDIGNIYHKNFQAANVTGTLNYNSGIVTFKTLKLNSLDGIISGNGFFAQNADKSFMAKGTFNLEEINVRKAFTVFNNFGQNFIRDENLEGILSGYITVLVPMDSLLHPLIKSVSAEGKYLLRNGALINFEPVRSLSDFIEISELENIRFEELGNDFFIRNNALYIPQMDVRSSAADLSVNGRHGFDNDYEYHVKILLSEILSKKFPKPKPNTTEFGAVKDDGLGRTSLLLKIEDKGKDVRVSYDVKAAGSQVRNDMKKERQSLKTILNEEYGWFKNDTAPGEKPTESVTPRFRVTWEEIDSTKIKTEEQPAVKNEKLIKNIFKKRY